MKSGSYSWIVVLLFGLCCANRLSDVIDSNEIESFEVLFEKVPSTNVENVYYALKGWMSLNPNQPTPPAMIVNAACTAAKSADFSQLQNVFYASEVLKFTTKDKCKFSIPQKALDLATSKLSKDSDGLTIYQAVTILKNSGKPVSDKDVISFLTSSVETVSNSVLSSSYAILAAAQLDKEVDFSGFLKQADVEDMAAQADEVEGSYSHFENDLATTGTFLNAAYVASSTIKGVKEIDGEQAIMLMNFVLKHKITNTIEQAYYVVSSLAASAKSKNTFVKVRLASGNSVSSANPDVKVSATDVFGKPVEGLSVKVDSLARSSDNEPVVSNFPLKKDAKSGMYTFKMWERKPKSGFYDVSLTVSASKATVFGVDDLEFKLKVTTSIELVEVKIGSVERDSSSSKLTSVGFMKKGSAISADTQQKLMMNFKVKDLADGSLFLPHQVFVRFSKQGGDEEVIFIAEADASSMYKFEVDLKAAAKEQFNSKSGKYSMELIVGDAAISNPIMWNLVDVSFKFDEEQAAEKQPCIFSKKPEIHHLFREKEPRPPALISTAFTFACLAPFFVLFMLWGKVGANLSNLSFAPANLVFHVGLAAIFGSYYMFWIKWNMFDTVRYLVGVGAITFLAGNRVLSAIARDRTGNQ